MTALEKMEEYMRVLHKSINGLCFCMMVFILCGGQTAAPAHAKAWWAWPGQEFTVDKGIYGYANCSVGFPGWDAHGNIYFITAAHCFRDSRTNRRIVYNDGSPLRVYDPNDLSTPIGFERLYPLPGQKYYDVSVVQMYRGRRLSGYGFPNIPTRPHESVLGQQACIAGFRSHHVRCGRVSTVDEPTQVKSFEGWGMERLHEARYCSWQGDSGGAVFDKDGALGISSSSTTKGDNACRVGSEASDYVPITDVMAIIRAHIPSFRIF